MEKKKEPEAEEEVIQVSAQEEKVCYAFRKAFQYVCLAYSMLYVSSSHTQELRRVFDELSGLARRCQLQDDIAAKMSVVRAEIARSNDINNENKVSVEQPSSVGSPKSM